MLSNYGDSEIERSGWCEVEGLWVENNSSAVHLESMDYCWARHVSHAALEAWDASQVNTELLVALRQSWAETLRLLIRPGFTAVAVNHIGVIVRLLCALLPVGHQVKLKQGLSPTCCVWWFMLSSLHVWKGAGSQGDDRRYETRLKISIIMTNARFLTF